MAGATCDSDAPHIDQRVERIKKMSLCREACDAKRKQGLEIFRKVFQVLFEKYQRIAFQRGEDYENFDDI